MDKKPLSLSDLRALVEKMTKGPWTRRSAWQTHDDLVAVVALRNVAAELIAVAIASKCVVADHTAWNAPVGKQIRGDEDRTQVNWASLTRLHTALAALDEALRRQG